MQDAETQREMGYVSLMGVTPAQPHLDIPGPLPVHLHGAATARGPQLAGEVGMGALEPSGLGEPALSTAASPGFARLCESSPEGPEGKCLTLTSQLHPRGWLWHRMGCRWLSGRHPMCPTKGHLGRPNPGHEWLDGDLVWNASCPWGPGPL